MGLQKAYEMEALSIPWSHGASGEVKHKKQNEVSVRLSAPSMTRTQIYEPDAKEN